jgi:hypothetical protein
MLQQKEILNHACSGRKPFCHRHAPSIFQIGLFSLAPRQPCTRCTREKGEWQDSQVSMRLKILGKVEAGAKFPCCKLRNLGTGAYATSRQHQQNAQTFFYGVRDHANSALDISRARRADGFSVLFVHLYTVNENVYDVDVRDRVGGLFAAAPAARTVLMNSNRRLRAERKRSAMRCSAWPIVIGSCKRRNSERKACLRRKVIDRPARRRGADYLCQRCILRVRRTAATIAAEQYHYARCH